MRAAVLHTRGQPPVVTEHPDPVPAPGRRLVRVTAAPVVPLDLLCASRHVVLRRAGRAVRARRAGRRRGGARPDRRAAAPGCGSPPRPGWRPATAAWPSSAPSPTPTWCRWRPTSPDALVAALGLSAVAAWMALSWRAGCSRASGCWCSAAAGRSGRRASARRGRSAPAAWLPWPRSERGATAGPRGRGRRRRPDGRGRRRAHRRGWRRRPGARSTSSSTRCSGSRRRPPRGSSAQGGRLVNLGGASGDEASFSSAVLRSRIGQRARLHEQRADPRAAPRRPLGGAPARVQRPDHHGLSTAGRSRRSRSAGADNRKARAHPASCCFPRGVPERLHPRPVRGERGGRFSPGGWCSARGDDPAGVVGDLGE